ncbi:penicillin-binding protein activator, partial [bacterium]|nr:penicillin-binding protein activator [candidate division CSSED10-310 bacterium]
MIFAKTTRFIDSPFIVCFLFGFFTFLAGCLNPSRSIPVNQTVSIESDRPQDAQRIYTAVIQSDPSSPEAVEANYRLGLIMLRSGTRITAADHFANAANSTLQSPWKIAAQIELIGLSIRDSLSLIDTVDTVDTVVQLEQCIHLLSSDPEPPHLPLYRARYHIARAAFASADWTRVLSFTGQHSESLDPFETGHLAFITGIAFARTGNIEPAIHTLESLVHSDHPHRFAAMSELVALDAQRGRPVDAILRVLTEPLFLTDPRILESSMHLLASDIPDATLQQLREQIGSGFGGLLIRFEIVDRLQRSGKIDEATDFLNNLKRAYPTYTREIEDKIADIDAMSRVFPEKIGILVPVSGPLSAIGQSVYRGAQQAIFDYQAAGGSIPFTLLLRDTGPAGPAIVEAFDNLAIDERVLAVVGPIRSQETLALMDRCTELGVPLITPGCPDDSIIGYSPWAFRLFPSPDVELAQAIRFAVRDYGMTRWVCLYPDIDYGRQAARVLETVIREEHAELLATIAYSDDLTGIQVLLSRLDSLEPDVILIPDNAERASVIAGQIRYREILTPTIAGIGAWDDPRLLTIAGTTLEGSFFVSSYPATHGARRNIGERYAVRFGENADAFSLRAYEAVYLIIQAVDSGIRFRPHLRDRWVSESDVLGLDGSARFTAQGDYRPPITVYRIRGSHVEPWRTLPVDRYADVMLQGDGSGPGNAGEGDGGG